VLKLNIDCERVRRDVAAATFVFNFEDFELELFDSARD
jgi:hypothetical protein